MKKLLSFIFLIGLTAGISNATLAQRGRGHDGGGRQGGGEFRGGGGFTRGDVRSVPQRNFVTRTPSPNYNNYRPAPRNYVTRPSYVPAGRYYSTYNYRGYNRGYSYHAAYRPVFMYGTRYRVIPRSYVSLYFGGLPYYYNAGFFYGYYNGFYSPLFPPLGISIRVLPFGYSRFFVGPVPYYYYNGIYYRDYDNGYQVVDAPLGATVNSLPQGAKIVVLNGETLYELNGTYYKSEYDASGHNVYVVVGKNGVVNNSGDANPDNNNVPYNNAPAPPQSSLQIGDMISELPEGSKLTTINGQQVYITPDDLFLQEEMVNGTVQYRVVGK